MPTGLREIRRLKAQGDLDGLLQALDVANKRQVRRKAAEALGDVGDARAVQALVPLLDDEDYLLRTISAVALGKIGDASAVEPLVGWLDMQRLATLDRRRLLMEYTFSKAWELPIAAAEALGRIGDARAVEPLVSWLARGVDGGGEEMPEWLAECPQWLAEIPTYIFSVKRAAAQALGRIGGARAAEALVTYGLTEAHDYCLISESLLALVSIGAAAVDHLIAALGGSHPGKGRRSSWGFSEDIKRCGLSDPKRLTRPLALALGEADGGARGMAAWLLGELGDVRALEPLAAALQDTGWNARDSAAEALAKLGGQMALSALESVLEDENRDVRNAAKRALKTLKASG
jgi:HEAT repeat protein